MENIIIHDLQQYEQFRPSHAVGLSIPILYEDNHLLIAYKEPGLLSQADKTARPDMLTLLKAYLVEKYQKTGDAWLGLLHRLDQPVGGLMIFAKTSKSARRMSELFRSGDVERIYHAVVHGKPEPSAALWQDFITESKQGGRYRVAIQGKYCELHYRRLGTSIVEIGQSVSLLQLELATGRAHQIRVQCAARGHPILGDRRYSEMTPLDNTVSAPALLATSLSFKHPVRKDSFSISLALPDIYPWQLFS